MNVVMEALRTLKYLVSVLHWATSKSESLRLCEYAFQMSSRVTRRNSHAWAWLSLAGKMVSFSPPPPSHKHPFLLRRLDDALSSSRMKAAPAETRQTRHRRESWMAGSPHLVTVSSGGHSQPVAWRWSLGRLLVFYSRK